MLFETFLNECIRTRNDFTLQVNVFIVLPNNTVYYVYEGRGAEELLHFMAEEHKHYRVIDFNVLTGEVYIQK